MSEIEFVIFKYVVHIVTSLL